MAHGGSDLLNIFYFRSVAGVHAFAHSQSHRAIWRWWEEQEKSGRVDHIGLYHELYGVEDGMIDTIYLRCCPTGLGAVSFQRSGSVDDKKDGEKQVHEGRWVSGLYDTGKGLKAMRERFGRQF